MNIIKKTHIKQSGFSLLEVLITLVIVATGLLGLAAMQARGLSTNHNAYVRSQATLLAYDLTDRMRANIKAKDSYQTNNLSTKTAVSGCISSGCSPVQMAQHDLYEWNVALTKALPSGTATVTFADETYTVTIMWDQDRDGKVVGDVDDPNFKVKFQL